MRWSTAGLSMVLTIGLAMWGMSRIELDSDILSALPTSDPVVHDAAYVLERLPVLDRVFIDVSLKNPSATLNDLLALGTQLKEELSATGLFASVGMDSLSDEFPLLLNWIMEHLPVLFSEAELNKTVEPLLTSEGVFQTLEQAIRELSDLGGIGMGQALAQDPLGLRNRVLARMKPLMPNQNARMLQGHLLSPDLKHLLMLAQPQNASTDGVVAQAIQNRLQEIFEKLKQDQDRAGKELELVHVGAFRAAYDNERIARADTKRTLLVISLALVLLLLLCFPRPVWGLFSLLPAFFGTALSLVVYSWFWPSLSLLALGFGGGLIAITVDHGIAYLLFLDQKRTVSGREASHELWAVGLVTVLTTAGAFFALTLSGFSILKQLGFFAGMGVLFSFGFVHTLLPLMFPSVEPARRTGLVPLRLLVGKLNQHTGPVIFGLALCVCTGLAFWARPQVQNDLSELNTVSRETAQDEETFKEIWGDVPSQVTLLLEADDFPNLQAQSDFVTVKIEELLDRGQIEAAFLPSMIFPGKERSQKNLLSWKQFWNPKRISDLEKNLGEHGQALGFTSDAFEPFLQKLKVAEVDPSIPDRLWSLLGVATVPKPGQIRAVGNIVLGPGLDSEQFFVEMKSIGKVRVLDANLFSTHLSSLILSTFVRMLWMCGLVVILVLILFFLDLRLVCLTLTPVVFALVCTLGTLRLIGHALDVPGILLAIIVLGMGIDYSLFFVRSQQRYGSETHPSLLTFRASVLLAALSTLIGFGTLATADHALLRSAGVTCALGIAFTAIGSFVLLPTLLRVFLKPVPFANETGLIPGSRQHHRLVVRRYRMVEAYPRQFAFFKLKLDPMFPRLAEFIGPSKNVLDIGCGYGVPGTWLAMLRPDLRLFGIDPDPVRVRVAQRVWGEKGEVALGSAETLPDFEKPIDAVLLLDVLHYLSDDEANQSLRQIKKKLDPKGRLVMRVLIPSKKPFAWERMLEKIRLLLLKKKAFYRNAQTVKQLLSENGFALQTTEATASKREETWFVAFLNPGEVSA